MTYKDPSGRLIREWPALSGSKTAIRRGGFLYVSPAMMTLIRDCQNSDDLFHLLDKIPFLVYAQTRPLPERPNPCR